MIFLETNEGNVVENFHPPIPYLQDDEERFLDIVGIVMNSETVEFVTCIDLGKELHA
jgi:hypothetical protein